MEIIHVAGHSCAGKRTLIKRLCDPSETELRKRFGITGSTERFWDNPEKRDQLFDETDWRPISELRTAEDGHLLHKWQFVTHGEILKLQSLRPELSHRVIVLWRPVSEMIRRIQEKKLWHPDTAEMQSQMKKLYRTVCELPEQGIPVEYVNASSPNYDHMADFILET
jgi:hypothetical protein